MAVLLCCTGILVLSRIGMNECSLGRFWRYLFLTLLDMLGTISCGLAKVLYLYLALSGIRAIVNCIQHSRQRLHNPMPLILTKNNVISNSPIKSQLHNPRDTTSAEPLCPMLSHYAIHPICLHIPPTTAQTPPPSD